MTSPMFESHTPMAKCKARNFCGRSTKPANALGDRVEVLVVNTVLRRGMPGRLAPEGLLDRQGLGHGLADQVGIAHRLRQVGRVAEASEGVVDLLAGGAALLDEVLGVLPMQCLALLQARGDGVVHDHVLAVKGHLPGDLRAHRAGARGGDLGEAHADSPRAVGA